jgi:DNA-binding NtrC family response regulator
MDVLGDGEALERLEVMDRWAALLKNRKGALSADLYSALLEDHPHLVQFCPDRATHLLDGADAATDLLEDAAALFEVAGRPDLLGRQAFDLFRRQGAVLGVALVARRKDAEPSIVAWSGWNFATACARARDAGALHPLKLGTVRGTSFTLLAEPRVDLVARGRALALRQLVESALALEAARHDERQRASLWVFDEQAEAPAGVFVSAATADILATARRIATTVLPILLTGETGTGKELLAREIHRSSPRTDRPFVPFNCSTVPRDMIDSQLFGYRRGASTGAQESFGGIIRAAAGGTLFLDELADLPLDVQPKLLRFLETGEIHPLGEPQPIKVDVRIVAATNAELDRLVADGRFREDLFYRLNVVRLRIPPLRERREEIQPLVQRFLQRQADEMGRAPMRVTDEAMEYLLLFAWPGNVRQLANELRRIAALGEPGGLVTPEHLCAEIRASRRTIPAHAPGPARNAFSVDIDQTLPAAIEYVERAMVANALRAADGRVERAAQILGISRKGLFLKRRRFGLTA